MKFLAHVLKISNQDFSKSGFLYKKTFELIFNTVSLYFEWILTKIGNIDLLIWTVEYITLFYKI